ncbi:response regulator [Pseudoalteromonas sp. 0303]|nr:response regulator [Pseudoalteromonas sp. 0303]
MRITVSNMLTNIGVMKVLYSSNGNQALSLLHNNKVDIIITELQLPEMDGIELLSNIRADEKLSNIPVVIMSANIEHSEVIRAINSGVSEYVVKPFSGKILCERLIRALDNPIKKSSLQRANKQSKDNAKLEKQSIEVLVVDDSIDNIEIISEILCKNYNVRVATSGEKALRICNGDHKPDLILLDIMMPEIDGFEVCKRLKSNPETQHISIIFISAMDQEEEIVRGLELGAVDYITKPVNQSIVLARVNVHSRLVETNKLMREQIDTFVENLRLRDDFDRIMQNDLKKPLQEIFKSVNVLESHGRDLSKVKNNTSAIKLATNNLSQMIDNLLTLNKLEDGSYILTPTAININKLLRNVVENFHFSIVDKHLEINLNTADNFNVYCEELLTLSLFSNLVKNAIEAAPRGSAVTISVTKTARYVVTTIQNRGAVPEQIRNSFFDKYVTAGKKNSAGVGTYGAKLMTEVQQGKIKFDTSEAQGTTLTVSLPIAEEKTSNSMLD